MMKVFRLADLYPKKLLSELYCFATFPLLSDNSEKGRLFFSENFLCDATLSRLIPKTTDLLAMILLTASLKSQAWVVQPGVSSLG